MTIEAIIRIIGLIIAPVVMISSCTLFLNGLQQRYDSLSTRMRSMHRERIELLRETGQGITAALKAIDGLSETRANELEKQLPSLLRRHRILRNAVLTAYVAILILVFSMFIIALAAIANSSLIAMIALFSFLAGTSALLLSVAISTFEVYQSHHEVTYEVQHGLHLGKETMEPDVL